ncbi:hypothetical protein GCM10011608_33400 [Micromonospora sonchi]|uniref:Oligosaccharide repeat unit polymerase n=1 Tax=Micromonospora sonchi TaxID=1763543 RepID=A0A917TYX9_9ACTN|nr:hypothetical protein [Micromonospora sonchi]GGM45973.1 hypothetical protein GCM10011608_33400 [Micromonospora sonchi]
MVILLLPVLALAAVHYMVAVRRYGILSPDGLFLACQLIMLYGTARLVDISDEVERYYVQLMAAAVAIYIVASLTTSLVATRDRIPGRAGFADYSVTLVAPRWSIYVVIAVAITVTIAYFFAVGYSAFLLGLQGQLSDAPVDIATLRLESYAGDRYLFPGFVNQFKNVILPALSLVLAVWSFSRGGLTARVGSVVLLGLSGLGLLATAQRGAMVMFLTTVVVYAYLHHRRHLPPVALLPLLLGAPLVILATYVLNRDRNSTEGPLHTALTDLSNRFLNDNQASGIAAFNYTHSRPVRYGGEWLESLLGILPSHRGSALSAEVFYTIYGSTRGTTPPSLWGSVHHNFDTFGLLLMAALFGVSLQILTQRTLRHREYNSLQLVGFAGTTVVLGTWVAGGIETPLNVGLAAYLGLWYWGGRIGNRNRQRTAHTRPTAVPGAAQSHLDACRDRPPATSGRQLAGRT